LTSGNGLKTILKICEIRFIIRLIRVPFTKSKKKRSTDLTDGNGLKTILKICETRFIIRPIRVPFTKSKKKRSTDLTDGNGLKTILKNPLSPFYNPPNPCSFY
jgi:hypothetical protein